MVLKSLPSIWVLRITPDLVVIIVLDCNCSSITLSSHGNYFKGSTFGKMAECSRKHVYFGVRYLSWQKKKSSSYINTIFVTLGWFLNLFEPTLQGYRDNYIEEHVKHMARGLKILSTRLMLVPHPLSPHGSR